MRTFRANDLVVADEWCGKWAIYAPGITKEQIESGEAKPLAEGEYDEGGESDGDRLVDHPYIPSDAFAKALASVDEDHHVIRTAKGAYAGQLLECLEWQATVQGAMPDIDGVDISDISIALASDPYRESDDIDPEEAANIVRERLQA